ncbi:hypothetical protein KKF34_13685 [Myxococcota bacterium]|nr:hypothetical protein [Myxococcota bacterium]MBU1379481.1 hypothetical protein [Myxococcota bacterium]MBU1497922.1 hypothetical protein [Myxococcota bacterium]
MLWIYIYISASVLIVSFIAFFFLGRKSKHYTGDKPIEERLKPFGMSLVGNKLEFDGAILILSEYWQIFESEGQKTVFTRLEYFYTAPLLRYFHVAKRPREEIINHAHSHSVDTVTTGNPVFDSFYMVRTQTGAESLSLLSDTVMNFMIKCAENEGMDIELFDNHALLTIPGKPEYLATDVFVDTVKKFNSFVRAFEKGRSTNPLPPLLSGIFDTITMLFGSSMLRKSEEGGSDLMYSLPSGSKVIFTLRAGNDGVHIRFPLIEECEYVFAISETSFPMQFPTEKFDIRVFSGENFKVPPLKKFKLLQISEKGDMRRNQSMRGFMAGKRRRMYQIFFQQLYDSGFFADLEKGTADLERICSRHAGDKIPSVELSSYNLRLYIPGPVSPRVPLPEIINIFDAISISFMENYNQIKEKIII